MRQAPRATVCRGVAWAALFSGVALTTPALAYAVQAPVELPPLPSLPDPPLVPAPVEPPPAPEVRPPAIGGAPNTGAPSAAPAAPAVGGAVEQGSAASGNLPSVTSHADGDAPGGPAAPAGTPSQRRATAKRRRAYEKRLRTTVKRARGCLFRVAPLDRRVLSLRGGVDGRARSRAATARRLRISQARVARAERRGLRTLRRGCGGAGGGIAAGVSVAAGNSGIGNATGSSAVRGLGIGVVDGARDRQGVGGARASSDGGNTSRQAGQSDSGKKTGSSPFGALRNADEGTGGFILFLLLGLAAVVGALDLLVRRRRAWLAEWSRARREGRR